MNHIDIKITQRPSYRGKVFCGQCKKHTYFTFHFAARVATLMQERYQVPFRIYVFNKKEEDCNRIHITRKSGDSHRLVKLWSKLYE